VGSVLCMLLARSAPDAKVLLVDKGAAAPPNKTFSITRGSALVLKSAGCWDAIEPVAYPLSGAQISAQGALGMLRMDGADLGADALSHSVFAPDLAGALADALDASGKCDRISASFRRAARQGDRVRVEIAPAGGQDAPREVEARLVVVTAASGDALRASGFRPRTHDYRQAIISCSVRGGLSDPGVAHERFAEDGVYAVVPHKGGCGLVACMHEHEAERAFSLGDADLIGKILAAHGRRLFEAAPQLKAKAIFPLSLSVSSPTHRGDVCLIGSALQSVHPIGGQGLNLALRDAYVWSELYCRDPAAPRLHARFAALRAADRRRVVASTHLTAKLGVGACPPLRVAGGLGMASLSALRPLREMAARTIFLGGMPV